MKQILVIHGGNSYHSYKDYLRTLENREIDYQRLVQHGQKWRDWLPAQLPDDDVLLPSFPNRDNAQYNEWVTYFHKLLPYLTQNITMVGHSLGAMFLAKYCNSHTLPIKLDKLILISPAYDDDSTEDLGSFKVELAVNVPKNAKQVHIFHSEDDPVVPFTELAKFQVDMPLAAIHTFANRGHFLQPTFPELLDVIKR